jgi:serine/threonine-protein kinase
MSEQSVPKKLRCPVCLAVFRTEFACCPVDGAELGAWMPDADPLVGGQIAGRYVLEELVGQGSMGLIYRARHVHLPRTFAIKILFGDLVADARMRIRFAQEAALASRLGHPNVVSVVDFGRSENGLLYLVMDYVEGEALSLLIEREAPLDQERVCRLTRQLAEGLAHAHEHGLVHRDFKPGNVVLEAREGGELVPRILDFGLAISTRERDEAPGRLTEFGFIVGTPIYIAPEQALDRAVDHRADLFALGVVMYEMLAGVPPFDGRPVEIAHKNVHYPAPPIDERNPGVKVAPELERIVRRLLEKTPDRRFSSAAEVCEALDQFEYRLQQAELDQVDEITEVVSGSSLAAGTGAFVRDDGPNPLEDPFADDPTVSPYLRLPTRWFGGMRARTTIAGAGALFVAGFLAFFLFAGGSDEPAQSAVKVASATEPVVKPLDQRADPHDAAAPAAPATPPQTAPDAAAPTAIETAGTAPSPETDATALATGNQVEAGSLPQAADAPARELRSAHAAQASARRRAAERARRQARLEEAEEDGSIYRAAGQEQVIDDEDVVDAMPETDPVETDHVTAGVGGAPAMTPSTTDDAPEVEDQAPAAPAEVDPKAAVRRLVREYREVGEAIASLQSRRGDGAARRFRERYFRLPYGDALRIEAVRKDTLAELEGLRLEVLQATRGGG